VLLLVGMASNSSSSACFVVRFLSFYIVWTVCTSIYAMTVRSALDYHAGLASSLRAAMLQLAVGSICTPIWKLRELSRESAVQFVVSGLCFMISTTLSIYLIFITTAGFTLTVKICEPMITCVYVAIVNGAGIKWQQCVALVMTSAGLAMCAYSHICASLAPTNEMLVYIAIGLTSNFMLTLRNTTMYKAAQVSGDGPRSVVKELQLFSTQCFFGAILACPVFMLMAVASPRAAVLLSVSSLFGDHAANLVAVSVVSFVVYNYASFCVLAMLDPALHSLLSATKRTAALAVACALTLHLPSGLELLGIGLVSCGVFTFKRVAKKPTYNSIRDPAFSVPLQEMPTEEGLRSESE